MTDTAQGYRSAAYRAALAHLGQGLALGQTGGFVLSRAIPHSDRRDLMGPYPMLCCDDWAALGDGVAEVAGDHVSLTCVTDPFCPLDEGQLRAIFDRVVPLHQHYLIDLAGPGAALGKVSKHHRKKVRHSDGLRIEHRAPSPGDLAAWCGLYAGLADRHGIDSLRRFGEASFAHQLAVPGAQFVLAWEGDALLGADLYYLDGDRAYAHLSAYAAQGYARSVSYPMMAHAITAFAGQVRWIDLGGVPALANADGIGHFKRGWTDVTRTAWLCGKVLDRAAFEGLSAGHSDSYFPPYRSGDFRE